jgi:type IV fimbrial biogenesis protein FimT
MQRKTRLAAQRGLTLTGTCLALAIGGILAGAALRVLHEARARSVAEGLSWELGEGLRQARSEAVARNEGVRFSFYESHAGRCYVIHTGDRSDCRCEDRGAAICENGAVALRSMYQAAGAPAQLVASVDSIHFDARNGMSMPGGTVCVVPTTGRQIRHTISSTGRVRNCSPDAPARACEPC